MVEKSAEYYLGQYFFSDAGTEASLLFVSVMAFFGRTADTKLRLLINAEKMFPHFKI